MSGLIITSPISLLATRDPLLIESWPNFIVYTASTTFTVPAGATTILCAPMGGGGGGSGGRHDGNAYDEFTVGGAGGGGAGYNVGQFSVTPGQNITITIGGGGAGGVNSNFDGSTAGSNGGASTVVGYLSSSGGFGAPDSGDNFGAGVFGGGAGGKGEIAVTGAIEPPTNGVGANDNVLDENRDRAAINNKGATASLFSSPGGGGGASYLGNGGFGGSASLSAVNGTSGSGPGAGGGGGNDDGHGGAGRSGAIEIRWM